MQADIHEHAAREQLLRQALPLLDIRAAGTNHFSWILSIRRRDNGEDLYPLFKQRWEAFDPNFEPLTRRVYETFGLFPVPGDTHLCEYLPWVSDPLTKPWDKYNLRLYDWDAWANMRDHSLNRLENMAQGLMPIDGLLQTDSEGALEMIESIAGAGTHYHLAANLPNKGQIGNLPENAIVETPVVVDGAGIHPLQMGPLPTAIAELCRHELVAAQLGIDAAVSGDRKLALQCLLLDPVITDIETARAVLDDYLSAYKDHLPQFWS
jgi:alpha-galactosidase